MLHPHSTPVKYAISIGSVIVIAGAKYALDWAGLPLHESPLLLFVVAVVVSAAYGGFWPGMLATLFSVVIVFYWRGALPAPLAEIYISWVRLGLFLVEGLLISWGAQIAINLRARRNEEAEKARRHLQAVIDTTPLAVVTYHPEDRSVLSWNKAAETIYGWQASEVIGKPVPFLPPDHVEESRDHTVKGNESLRLHKSGRTIPVQLWIADVINDECYCLHIAADISDKRRIEEQLRQSSKMEAIGRLAGGIAHDLNNMLQVVMSYADMLLDPVEDVTDREAALEIVNASRRAADMTGRLLTFSRQQVSNPKLINLKEAVERQANFIRRLLTDQVKLELQLSNSTSCILMDPSHFDQILMNLAANARNAMPGGGTLTIAAQLTHIDTETHPTLPSGDYVKIVVTDTGIGMPDEIRVRIFEPFFSTRKDTGGTGLGLATVYGIVKQSNGDIFVYSEPGKGTTFHIYLPEGVGQPEAQRVQKPKPVRSGGREKVLVVEDDPQILPLVNKLLTAQNYEVVAMENGVEAIAYARENPGTIDLLVTDVLMPDTNGREIAEAVHATQPNAKILFMSGFPGEMQTGLPANVDFLQKPFTANDLLNRVRKALTEGVDHS